MKILLLSPLVDDKDYIKLQNDYKISNPGQKFYSLLYKGLLSCNVKIGAVSFVPEKYKGLLSKSKIKYIYVPNNKFVRLFGGFSNTSAKAIKNYITSDTIIIADGETYWPLVTALKCKCPVINLLTDFPQHVLSYSTTYSKKNIFYRFAYEKYELSKMNNHKKADGYILLTEYMTEVVGKEKPYVVTEGFTDYKLSLPRKRKHDYGSPLIISYLGGLNDKSGIMTLAEAIQKSDVKNIRLEVYGVGEYGEKLNNLNDARISYKGVVDLNQVLRIEAESDFLINPRPSGGDFNKYSFPSKTLEYMTSGTPVITTRLAGIPKEYDDYLIYLDDSSVDSMADSLNGIVSSDYSVYAEKGVAAARFAIEQKNNKIQAGKIIELCEKMIKKQ